MKRVMDTKEKLEFCEDLIRRASNVVMVRVIDVPENWDCLDLRYFVAKTLDMECVIPKYRKKGKRAYKKFFK